MPELTPAEHLLLLAIEELDTWAALGDSIGYERKHEGWTVQEMTLTVAIQFHHAKQPESPNSRERSIINLQASMPPPKCSKCGK